MASSSSYHVVFVLSLNWHVLEMLQKRIERWRKSSWDSFKSCAKRECERNLGHATHSHFLREKRAKLPQEHLKKKGHKYATLAEKSLLAFLDKLLASFFQHFLHFNDDAPMCFKLSCHKFCWKCFYCWNALLCKELRRQPILPRKL